MSLRSPRLVVHTCICHHVCAEHADVLDDDIERGERVLPGTGTSPHVGSGNETTNHVHPTWSKVTGRWGVHCGFVSFWDCWHMVLLEFFQKKPVGSSLS